MSFTKLAISGFFTIASLNATADVMSGFMDLSKLYGRTNAGQYFIGLALDVKDSANLEVTQKLSAPPSEDQPDTEPQVCLTEFRVNAGNLTLVLTDSKKDMAISLSQEISIYTSYFDTTQECTPVKTLLEQNIAFRVYLYLGAVKINYTAPKNYDAILTSLSVFPYGYSVYLNFEKNADGTITATNLKSQLSAQIKRGNKEGIRYYTYAQKDTSTLSLGTGLIELK